MIVATRSSVMCSSWSCDRLTPWMVAAIE